MLVLRLAIRMHNSNDMADYLAVSVSLFLHRFFEGLECLLQLNCAVYLWIIIIFLGNRLPKNRNLNYSLLFKDLIDIVFVVKFR